MFGRRSDRRPPLERATTTAAGLKPGTWAGVEALALLAVELKDRPEGSALYATALEASADLAAGTWESVRALACLARAGREIAAAER